MLYLVHVIMNFQAHFYSRASSMTLDSCLDLHYKEIYNLIVSFQKSDFG